MQNGLRVNSRSLVQPKIVGALFARENLNVIKCESSLALEVSRQLLAKLLSNSLCTSLMLCFLELSTNVQLVAIAKHAHFGKGKLCLKVAIQGKMRARKEE